MASEKGTVPHVSQVIEEFETFGLTLSHEAANQCLVLCKQYGLDGEQLAVLWLTFSHAHHYETVTLEALDHLDRVEQNSLRKKATAAAAAAAATNRLNASVDNGCLSQYEDDDNEELLEAYGGGGNVSKAAKRALTPKDKRSNGKVRSISAQFHSATLSPTVASPSLKYSTRTNSGMVVAQHGNSDNITWAANPDFHPKVKLLGTFEGEPSLTKAYNFMYEKPSTVGDVLSDLTISLGKDMQDIMLKKDMEEEEEEYSSLSTLTSETISAVGRIRCDGTGHLNAASLMVEGHMERGRSSVVKLDLSNVKSYSVFPGQVVGIKGTNPSGSKLIAQELIDGKVPPDPSSSITVTSSTGPVQLVVASGPFTTNSNLLYEPLTDLLTIVRDNPPHVLILLGPFLDSGHPLVIGNDLGETHDAVFKRCLRIITSTLQSTLTKVILVPSSRDMCSPMVYPTPPYDVAGNFMSVSDPALLNIEGVVVALTATDVLFHLGKEEISSPSQPDRMGRLTRHILKQRNFYPLYPAHESMCVVMEQLENHAHLPCKPHLLIIPSNLRYFTKEVEGCVVVNPEHLAKGLIGGTYARIELHSPSGGKGMLDSINVNVLKV